MPSSICLDGPEPWCNVSSGPDGDGIQTPGHTGQTQNPPCGTAALQADISRACPCAPVDWAGCASPRHRCRSRWTTVMPTNCWLAITGYLWQVINARRHYRVFGPLEQKFLERSLTCSRGTKVPRERKFHGSETCGLFAPGNEIAEERKGLHSNFAVQRPTFYHCATQPWGGVLMLTDPRGMEFFLNGTNLYPAEHARMWHVNTANVHASVGFGNLRTAKCELVICELIVRTTDTNLGYNANQKVQTFYAIKRGPYMCLCICNAEMTFITIQNAERNRLSLHVTKIPQTTCVRCGGNYLHYTGPTYMPNQRINMAQKESHSKILPSPTYMEITKNSIGLSRSKGLHVCRTLWLSALGYRVYLTLHNCSFL